MVTNAIRNIIESSGWNRGQARAEARVRWETAIVYDYDLETGDQVTWRGVLPLEQLEAHLPTTCRYVFDIHRSRMWGAVFGALLGTGVITIAAAPVFSSIAPVVGLLFGAAPGLFLGFIFLPRYGPKPIWIMRRVWADLKEAEVDPLSIQPDMVFQGAGQSRRTIVPVPHAFSEENTPLALQQQENYERPAQSMERLGFQGPDGNSATYYPIVHRATTFYEMLQQRVAKRRMSKVSMGTWPKVAIGSIALLALGTLGILFFVFTVSNDQPEATSWLIDKIQTLRI